jgi:hypothetical protein
VRLEVEQRWPGGQFSFLAIGGTAEVACQVQQYSMSMQILQRRLAARLVQCGPMHDDKQYKLKLFCFGLDSACVLDRRNLRVSEASKEASKHPNMCLLDKS